MRTTPRTIKNDQNIVIVNKEDYLSTILQAIDEFEASVVRDGSGRMLVRVILSVDRAKSVEDGRETIEMCHRLRQSDTNSRIVGIDFSGDPKMGSLKSKFRPLLDLCRVYRIPTTIHIGEMWNDEEDLDFILYDYRPERIGHAVCLHEHHVRHLIERPIAIEICPTSNLTTKCVESIDTHRFGEFWRANRRYPMVICTDDCGLFDTSLTRDYFLVAQAFGLGMADLFGLSKGAIDLIFDKSDTVKEILMGIFDDFEKINRF